LQEWEGYRPQKSADKPVDKKPKEDLAALRLTRLVWVLVRHSLLIFGFLFCFYFILLYTAATVMLPVSLACCIEACSAAVSVVCVYAETELS
jgi:hypothetical protein